MTTTLLRDRPDRHVLRIERRLPHTVEHVWSAVTEPDELAAWFPAEVAYEPRVGAPMRFDFGGGAEVGGEVTAWEPPRLFAFDWNGDELRFELAPAGGGCLLVFTHAFAPEAGRPARDGAGWEVCLDALARVVAGEGGHAADGSGGTAWQRAYDALRTKLGEVTVEAVGDGWEQPRAVRLFGPAGEVDGRTALAAHLVPPPPGGEDPVLLVAREAGSRLVDGAGIDVRAGTPEEPGALLAAGVLRDPLTAG